MLIRYTTFGGVLDKTPKGKIEQWELLAKKLMRHGVQPAKPDGKQARGALWSPTVYAPDATRLAENVELVTCFVADIDDGTDPAELHSLWHGLRFVLHSSFSSTPEHPKWRVIFPLRRAVAGSEWGRVWKKLNHHLMGGHCDPATKDPSRLYFWPSCPQDGQELAFADSREGALLDPDTWPDLGEIVKPAPRFVPAAALEDNDHELAETLLAKYTSLARPGGRNSTAFDLACQLRDNGIGEGEALALLERFKASMGAGFDDDMHHIWEQAMRRRAREPWAKREAPPQSAPPQGKATTPPEKACTYTLDRWTDVGNKDRFLRHFADQIRFDPTRGWMVWDGVRWGQDPDGGQVLGFAVLVARALYDEEEPEDTEQKKLWRQFVKSSNQLGKIRAAVELAKSDPRVRVCEGVWDANPWIINCKNGILDLTTGELGQHDPLAFCTYCVSARYDKNAKAPTWERCLATWQPDPEVRDYLARHSGYCLTGDTGEQVVAFHYGDGGNGKSIFTGTIEHVMGSYATRVPFAVLTDDKPRGGSATPDIARLAGRRMVIGSEIMGGRGINESLIKDLTGGDILIARHLHAAPFEFRPAFKLTLYGNHKPLIRNQDEGIWRRLPLIEWGVSIPQAERDKQLLTKLQAEADGIFAWMVAGCLAWQERGLVAPVAVQASSASYRDEQDQLGKFIRECCTAQEGTWCSAKELRSAYETWCEDNGEKWQASPNQFGERLRRAGAKPDAVKRIGGKNVRGWAGIGLVTDTDFELASPENTPSATAAGSVQQTALPRQSAPATAATPLRRSTSHTHARAHIINTHSAVTAVAAVAEVEKERPKLLPSEASPAVAATRKKLLKDTQEAVKQGRVARLSPEKDAAWRSLSKRGAELNAEHGELWIDTPEGQPLFGQLLDIAVWWARSSKRSPT